MLATDEDAVPATPVSPWSSGETPKLTQGLAGLMEAFELLKTDVGYTGKLDEHKVNAFQEHLADKDAENAFLRKHAEEAISVAEQLRDDVEELQRQLAVAKIVDETQVLTTVAYEYDHEFVDEKVAKFEAAVVELTELQQRNRELEEENRALTEMLNESRENQQQLAKLRNMENVLPLTSSSPSSSRRESVSSAVEEQPAPTPEVTLPPIVATSTPSSPDGEPPADASGRIETNHENPLAVADALAAVAGGRDTGIAGLAARMLRQYSASQRVLEQEREEKAVLQQEVQELNELVSSKTFKAPSAWAEREVKYKQDKRRWEEEEKSLRKELQQVCADLQELRMATGAIALERRIEELEARLLESERQRDMAQAALHEMQIASRSGAGEYSKTGVKPYQGPRLCSEGDVHQLVEHIESSGGTPQKSRLSHSTHSNTAVATLSPYGEVTQRPAMHHDESNAKKLSGWETPEAVLQALRDTGTMEQLQQRLLKTRADKVALQQALEALRAADATPPPMSPRVRLLLRASEAEARAEVALLQAGIDVNIAHELAALEGQRQDVALRKEQVREEGDGDELNQQNTVDAQVQALQHEKEDIEGRMRQVASSTAFSSSVVPSAAEIDDMPSPVIGIIASAAPQSELHDGNGQRLASPVADAAAQQRLSKLRFDLSEVTDGGKEHRIKRLEDLLHEKIAAEERLNLALEAPLRRNSCPPGADDVCRDQNFQTPPTGMSRKSSGGSLTYNTEGLAQDRAAVEAAWEAHAKSSDVSTLIRSKVMLETQVQVLQAQLEKAQEALAVANRQRGLVEESIEDAIAAGDLGMLAGVREGLRTGSRKLLHGRRFKSPFKRRGSPTKERNRGSTGQEMPAAPSGTGNRDSAKLPFSQRTTPRTTPKTTSRGGGGVGEGAEADAVSIAPSDMSHVALEDVEAELSDVKIENQMIMEQLVTTKVKLAEVEGDVLEARRSLVRSREIQMQLARQLREAQQANSSGQEQASTATSMGAPGTGQQVPESDRRRALRLPGLI